MPHPSIFSYRPFAPPRSIIKRGRAIVWYCPLITLASLAQVSSSLRSLLNQQEVRSSAGDQALLDARDGEARVQTLGAGLGAVHDRVAAIELEAGKV
jgi:hypothetical protein